MAWSGDLAEGERVLAPLRGGCPPALDLVGPMPYVALQSMLDADGAPRLAASTTACTTSPEVSDDFIDALLAGLRDAPDAAVARR